MQFKNQWPGDAITAPVACSYDREQAIFECLAGVSGDRPNTRPERADPDPSVVVVEHRPDAVLGSLWPAPSSGEEPRPVAINGCISYAEPARSLSKPNTWRPRVTAVVWWVIDLIIEGFALSSTAVHPGFLRSASEYSGLGDRARDPTAARQRETGATDFAVRRSRVASIVAILAQLWSRILRERQIRRMRAAWETIDERTLKDIGTSRCEIEYAKDARHWR
jgi:uncharacterized protein YjiS (DUF1127 family)